MRLDLIIDSSSRVFAHLSRESFIKLTYLALDCPAFDDNTMFVCFLLIYSIIPQTIWCSFFAEIMYLSSAASQV